MAIFHKLINKRISKMKLKSKIRFIILSLLIPILLITIFSLGILVIKLTNDIEKRMQVSEKSVKRAIELNRRQMIISAKLIAGNPIIQNNLIESIEESEKQVKLIDKLLALQKTTGIEYSWIYNKSGAIIARGHMPTDKSIKNDADYFLFKNNKDREIVFTIEYEKGVLFFKYAVPIFSEQNKGDFLGCIIVASKVSKNLSPVFATNIQQSSGVNLFIIAENMLVSTSFGIPLGDTAKIPFNIHSKTKLIKQVPGKSIRYDLQFVDLWNIKHIKNFGILIAVDNSSLKDTLRQLIIIMLASFLLVTFIAYILSRKVSSNILHSTNEILKGTEYVANTDFSYKIELEGNDELVKLSHTFNSMAESIKNYSTHMEDLVAQRTAELKKAFEEVHSLKIQQDGDYFLTSLLINPLLVNNVQGDIVKAEFYLKQKKRFNFKTRSGEIGGDVCIAHSMNLRGKNYTVFVNGDAMGKSLQGAGGALVMGVVFNAYVERTKLVHKAQETYPEKWLRDCFHELQSIFSSFDGSMLMSAVVGMIDEETGMMYYFNAEHPWVALYRDGKADFIEHELVTRKIGIVGFDKGVVIRMKQLQPKDIVIMGSDGRDDIMLGVNEETGARIINEDEYEFLRKIEAGSGDLNGITEKIIAAGELTDDLSLLKITYLEYGKELVSIPEEFYDFKKIGETSLKNRKFDAAIHNFKEALEIYKEEQLFLLLNQCYHKKKDYLNESYNLEEAIRFYPGNLNFVYRAAIVFKLRKKYEKAIDFGERYRIYFPNHVDNLINLADAYRITKNLIRTNQIIKEIEEIDVQNKYLLKLKELMN